MSWNGVNRDLEWMAGSRHRRTRARARGAAPRPRSGAEAGRTPCPKGGGQEELPHIRGQGQRPSVPGCNGAGIAERSYPSPRSGAVARRSYPTPEARGTGQEDQPHIQGVVGVRVQEGLDELPHNEGQEGWQ